MHVRTCNFTIFILKKSTLWSPFETPIYSKIGCHLWTFPEVKFGASFILFYISSEFQRQSFVFQSHENSTKNGLIAEEDLHIYLIDSENLTNSKMILEVMMRNRSRKNKEFWFIDISAFQTITNAELMLNSLPLDIDDDIFDREQSFARGLRNSFSSSSSSSSALLENLLHFWAILKHVVQTWSNLIKLDWIGSKWIKLVQTCSNMFKLDQIGSKWIKLVQTWSNLIKHDQTWSNLIRLDQTWSDLLKLDQTWSNLIRLDKTWSDLIRVDQTWSDLIKLDQTCSNLNKLVQTWWNWIQMY